MNTEQQQNMYTLSIPSAGTVQNQQPGYYYSQPGQMPEQVFSTQSIRPQIYQQRMSQPGYGNPAIGNGYHVVMQPYMPGPQFVPQAQRGSPGYISLSRPEGYMQNAQFTTFQPGNMAPNTAPIYPYYTAPGHYAVQQNFTAPTGPTIPTNTQMQMPYVTNNMNTIVNPMNQGQIPSQVTSVPSQMDQHGQPIITNQVPTQPSSGSQQSSANREKKPLAIIDPSSGKPVEFDKHGTNAKVVTSTVPTTTTDNEKRPNDSNSTESTVVSAKSNDDQSSVQKQSAFRRDFAAQLGDSSTSQTTKPASNTNVNRDDRTGASINLPQAQMGNTILAPVPRSKSPPPNSTIQSTTPSASIATTKATVPGAVAAAAPVPATTAPAVTTTTVTTATMRSATTHEPINEKPSVEEQQTSCTPTNESVVKEKVEVKPKESQSEEKLRERSGSQKQSRENFEKKNSDRKSTSDDATNKREGDRTISVTKPATRMSSSGSPECVTPPETPSALTNKSEATSFPMPPQRLRYDREELIRIRENSTSLPIPELPDLDIIINRRDNQRFSHNSYTGTSSHGRMNPPFNRHLSSTNHPSLNRYPNTQNNMSQDSRRKQQIFISNEPDFGNRSDNPYKPVEQAKIDASNRVLREIKAILNKVTPQTYDKLLKQLETLDIDRYERLEGMITIFFSKAVDEPAFSFLYAKLCKQFQKKQVTVIGEDGKTETYYFRQILLTRCQKEFESDYRQEIEYEKRKKEVEEITEEKKQKEEAEKLEEDLVKAKRRKLGNIFFIGELFKLQMLTDTIMYDCIEYLLRDKLDEEALECLCRLLRTIGKELDVKACEKAPNKQNLEKHYRELEHIIREQKTSARIRFMIQDLMELRQASWVARRVEAKPLTIDEIHEEERQKRLQQEREIDRERQQRRDQNRSGQSGGRGSGIRTQTSRNDEDRVENRFNVNSLRQLQSNDRRNQGPVTMSLAPQRTWSRGSGVDKKADEDFSAAGRGKPPAGPVQQLKGKSSSQGNSSNPLQRQSSRELARESSHRDRENALQSLRKTTGNSGVHSPIHGAGNSSITNSREGSRNVSREQSRNASRESSVSERASIASLTARTSKSSALDPSTIINQDPSDSTFDEEKTKARVHSLVEEYTENYSDSTDRPVKESLEDLVAFRTSNPEQQAIIIRELFLEVLEAKPRARKAVGHLLDAALEKVVLSDAAFLSGFKMIVDLAPDYAVDIPLFWQYIGEILGAFVGAPSQNFHIIKPILGHVPNEKNEQMFQYIIRYATEFSDQSHLQKLYHLSGLSLDEIVDAATEKKYLWLTEGSFSSQGKDNHLPHPDQKLVNLFKSCQETNSSSSDHDILSYINEHMDPKEKFYIRNIVLSYLQACLINREPQKKIQEDIAKKRMSVLNAIIQHKPEAEIQAVYAIQNFVHKLEHPPKMARLLFDIFYDEECVSEDAFFDWLKHPDQSETEGHSVVEISTKDFFNWLQQAETEVEEGEEDGN